MDVEDKGNNQHEPPLSRRTDLREVEAALGQSLSRKPKGFLPENRDGTPIESVEATMAPYLPNPQGKPTGRATETARPETQPYILKVEVDCEACGGSGFDPGGIDPWGPEQCGVCFGAKTLKITRNYLAEAFQIAANHESTRPVERQHLVAVIQHCRQAVSLVLSLPELEHAFIQSNYSNRKGEH